MLSKKLLTFIGLLTFWVAASAQASDLVLAKFANDESDVPVIEVEAGAIVVYQLRVTDTKEGVDAIGVVVTDTVPVGVSITSVDAEQGTCTVSGQQVTCDVGTVSDGTEFNIFINGVLDSSLAIGDEISNTATATTANEVSPANNSSTYSFVVGAETV